MSRLLLIHTLFLALYFCFAGRDPGFVQVLIPGDDTTQTICKEVKAAALAATLLSKTDLFEKVVAELQKNAAVTRREWVVSFGKDRKGSIIRSAASEGNAHSGRIPAVANRFADIHIHTDEKPPSSGDLYGFIDMATKDTSYLRYTLTPSGQLYVLTLTNKQSATDFTHAFPKRAGLRQKNPAGGTIYYQPTFPTLIIEEFDRLKGWHGASDEMALVLVMQKYQTGLSLLKQNTDGEFKRLIVVEKKDENGIKKDILINCP